MYAAHSGKPCECIALTLPKLHKELEPLDAALLMVARPEDSADDRNELALAEELAPACGEKERCGRGAQRCGGVAAA